MRAGVLWNHALAAAVAAEELARTTEAVDLALAFQLGLLHDIGRFALAQITPRRYGRIDSLLTGDALVDAERNVLGITHPEAGYLLACRWDFPPEIAEAIRYHQFPNHASLAKPTVNIVALASRMAETYHQDAQSNVPFRDRCTWSSSALTLDAATENQVYAETVRAMQNTLN